jgi:hypothetical protein
MTLLSETNPNTPEMTGLVKFIIIAIGVIIAILLA